VVQASLWCFGVELGHCDKPVNRTGAWKWTTSPRSRVFHECNHHDLIKTDGKISGGSLLGNTAVILFETAAVVLATRHRKSFKTTSTRGYTGDGHGAGLRAGRTLINMEFIQFHPTGWSGRCREGTVVTESVRGERRGAGATPRANGSCSTTCRTCSRTSTPPPRGG